MRGFSIYESKGGFEPRYGKLDINNKKIIRRCSPPPFIYKIYKKKLKLPNQKKEGPHQGVTRHQQQNRKKILFHYLNDTKGIRDKQIC